MALHHQLHALGERLGTGVFDDSDSFRGALDDFLDEGAATSGEINLLVDTVRLGAYQRLVTMIDRGADPAAAVATAGELLARERGSADLDGSRWACAVLGFATDRVPATEVDRYYNGTVRPTGQSEGVAPTAVPPPHVSPRPPQPTAPVPPVARGFAAQHPPAAVPPTARVAPTYGGQGTGGGPIPPGYGTAPKKSRWGLILAAVVVTLALIAGGAWWAVAGRDQKADTPGPSPSPSTTPPTDEFGVDAVSARYAGLAPAMDNLLFPCTPTTTAVGETEHLNCDASDGARLELVTFDSESSLADYREYVVDNSVGSVYESSDGQTYYSENPAGDRAEPFVYWDDTDALQSARVGGLALKELKADLVDIEAVVTTPTKPSNDALRAIIDENLPTLNRCKRIENNDVGQSEYNLCRDGSLYIYYAHYTDLSNLFEYRRFIDQTSDGFDGTTNDWQYDSTPKVDEGKRIEWVDPDTGNAHLYWDVEECQCSIVAIAVSGNQNRLFNWWLNAE